MVKNFRTRRHVRLSLNTNQLLLIKQMDPIYRIFRILFMSRELSKKMILAYSRTTSHFDPYYPCFEARSEFSIVALHLYYFPNKRKSSEFDNCEVYTQLTILVFTSINHKLEAVTI